MEFDYTVITIKDFDSAVKSVQEEIVKAGMRVLHIHDVQKTLAEKGFEREPFKIIEFCSAKYAYEFLNADIKIGLCLPCKINVYVKDGQTFITPDARRITRRSMAGMSRRSAPRAEQRSLLKKKPHRLRCGVFISGMRPVILPQFFPQASLGDKPKEIDQIIQKIINNAK